MSARIVITITEDDDPNGYVEVDYDLGEYDINTALTNADLPPAIMLGARLLQVVHEELPEVGGTMVTVTPTTRAH
jgi:hypothetical protein